jgi:hypothetical protein
MNYPERPLDPPESPTFTGDVVFAAFLADETVEVFAKVEDDVIERESTEVRYHGIDIAPILCEQQWASLEKQFDEDFENITHFEMVD